MARLIDPGYVVDASANWFFMIGSTFLVTVVASVLSLKIVEPIESATRARAPSRR